MKSDNFYDILWVSKTATKDEIKKAYRKKAMEHHPDRWWDQEHFKKINEAYDVLSDDSKRKKYDMYWSTWWNPFSWWWFDFSDIFWWWSQKSYSYTSSWWWFDFSDFFSWFWNQNNTWDYYEKKENLDIEKTYEIPIFDMILWCKIEITWYNWDKAKLNIPKNTKPWTKFRVKWFGKKSWSQVWNMIVTADAKMPKSIDDSDLEILKNISNKIKY